MRGLKRAQYAVSMTAIAVVATACSSGSSGSGTKTTASSSAGTDGGTVSINLSEPQHLIPTNAAETNASEVLDALFTGLIKFDKDNKAQYTDLAESVESPDNTVWTIKIKPGWKFANGEPVTVDSFIDAWNYGALSTNGQQNSYFFANIKGYADVSPTDPNPDDKVVPKPTAKTMSGLAKVSDTEMTVTLSQPDNTFKIELGYAAFYPLPKAAFADMKAFEQAPIGNGPFKMSGTWVHNQLIKVVRNDAYSGATKPHVSEIDYKMYTSQDTAYNELISGSLDVLTQVPSASLGRAKTDLGDRYADFPSSNYGFIGFPVFDPTFKDVNVRKGISEAIDRASIMKTVFNGTRVPADDFVAPIVPGYRKGGCGEACVYDRAKAKATFSAAANPPTAMTLTYNADGGHKEWMEAACNSIHQALGIQCVAKPQPDFATMLNNLDKAKKSKQAFGAFRLGWIMDYPSAQDYLGPLYSTNGGSNYYGYSNKEFDALVLKGQAASEADSIPLYQQADDILAKDFPAAPMYYGSSQVGWSKRVSNVNLDAYQRIDKFALTVSK